MNKNQRKLLLTKIAQEAQITTDNESSQGQGKEFADKIFDQLLEQMLSNLDKDLGI